MLAEEKDQNWIRTNKAGDWMLVCQGFNRLEPGIWLVCFGDRCRTLLRGKWGL